MTYIEDIPFHYIGKGEQCLVKTKLALGHKKAEEANIILLEEPENHLSYSKLNQLIRDIKNDSGERQISTSTHNSFVANKLGLEHLILLDNRKTVRLNELSDETQKFFEKLSGYDTLRLVLCEKAILVEGDSDELIVQKAFMTNNDGKLPIEKGVDVISVGTSFLRFLEVSEYIGKIVAVVTDNDGNVEALTKKYANFLGNNAKENIKICFDSTIDSGDLEISGKPFNYNTLEPKLLKENIDQLTVNPTFTGQQPSGSPTATQIIEVQRQARLVMGLTIFVMSLLEKKLGELRLQNILENWFDPVDTVIDEIKNVLVNKYRSFTRKTP